MQQPRERLFSHHPASVAGARTFVVDVLADWRLFGRADDVRVCVSELATNALRHGAPKPDEFLVRVLHDDDTRVRVEVLDRNDGVPVARQAPPDDPHGRGLFLVEALADDWGVVPGEGTKSVWAEFKFPTASGPGVASC
ncbi:ATP-binding protein [Streptomyces sp. NPDC053794]|uniref:ATP-binding protein n=1 Tax=Streptomyces sp. NPDC053794 TaxID=3154760 RepID=UPI00343D2D0A